MTDPNRHPVTVLLNPGIYRSVRALAYRGGMSRYIAKLVTDHVAELPIGHRAIVPFHLYDEGGGP